MFKSFLLTALRSHMRNKVFALVSVGGLALGFTAVALILLFVEDEMSFDNWIPNSENIYLLQSKASPAGREASEYATSPGPVGNLMLADFEQIEKSVRVFTRQRTIRFEDIIFVEKVSLVDKGFFDLFPMEMVSGSRQAVIEDGNSIIISERMAIKYFGSASPLGKVINYHNSVDYKVVGVFENIPRKTHFDTDFIALFVDQRFDDQPWVAACWRCSNVLIYFRLAPGVQSESLEAQFPAFVRRHFPVSETDPNADPGLGFQFSLISVPQIHLYGSIANFPGENGDIAMVISFTVIAFLILIIASINYTNLATARAVARAREVGLRKVLGASRGQLIRQFLGESVITSLFGLMAGLALVEAVLPYYNNFLDRDLSLAVLIEPIYIALAFGLAFSVGILGGVFPARYLSSLSPSGALKAEKHTRGRAGGIRNILVVLQFAVSIALIVSTAVVYAQTSFARNVDPGFDKKLKLTLYAYSDQISAVHETLSNQLAAIPGVATVVQASDGFPQGNTVNRDFSFTGDTADNIRVETWWVSPEFFEVYDVPPLAGRLFGKNFRGDFHNLPDNVSQPGTQAAVVNERFAQLAGWSDAGDAIGQTVYTSQGERRVEVNIVGVIRDIYSRSLRRKVTPTLYFTSEDFLGVFTLQLAGPDFERTAAAAKRVWQGILPNVPVNISRIETNLDDLYNEEGRQSKIFAVFAVFAVFVSCLGLYALAKFVVEQRTQEIGIRKVLGASVTNLVGLLAWQFTKPVLMANLIAWPIAWLVMEDWLEGFAYRIDLNPVLFVLAGLGALLIAWMTVAGHAFRVARSNPINALKYE